MCIYSTVRRLRAGGGFYKRTIFCGERIHLFIISGFRRAFSVPLRRRFRKCGEKSSFADQTGFFDNKTAGHKSPKERYARGHQVFPRTSEIRALRRRQQAYLRNACPTKTGGSRHGYHPFVLHLAQSRPTTSLCRGSGAWRPMPRPPRSPSHSSRSRRGRASGR